jgi:hypothetical protein
MKKRTIGEKNAAFWKLSRNGRRIAVAKDVLAQVAARVLEPSEGKWLELRKSLVSMGFNTGNYYREELKLETDLQALLGVPGEKCNACGVGAAFMSMARLGDRAKVTDDLYESLEQVFTPPQIQLIEYAFEQGRYGNPVEAGCTHSLVERAAKFGRGHRSAKKRMVEIFRNIVRNKGEFKP